MICAVKKKMTFVAIAIACSALLAGCATKSPAEHDDRLRKAAGLEEFYIVTTPSLWEATAVTDVGGGKDAISVEPTELGNGLNEYKLDGVTLADYLRRLDYQAHGGTDYAGFGRLHEAESARMYDEIVAVLDEVTERPAPDAEPLRVIVDDAFAPEDS
jgi:hypothetical protein